MTPVVFAPFARAELEAAAQWYEVRAPGLGEQLVLGIDETLQRISEAPASFPKWEGDQRFRRVVVQRFPYVVFYRERAGQIEVTAIAHGARKPGYWLERE